MKDKSEQASTTNVDEKPDGWIWNVLHRPGMTDEEVQALEIEGMVLIVLQPG